MKTVMEMNVWEENGKLEVTVRDSDYKQVFFMRSNDPYFLAETISRMLQSEFSTALFPPNPAEPDPGFEATTAGLDDAIAQAEAAADVNSRTHGA